jgi:hypothetical protein
LRPGPNGLIRGDKELAQLIALIFTVNTWNRVNVATRKTPGTE